jgi:hypothetical protein
MAGDWRGYSRLIALGTAGEVGDRLLGWQVRLGLLIHEKHPIRALMGLLERALIRSVVRTGEACPRRVTSDYAVRFKVQVRSARQSGQVTTTPRGVTRTGTSSSASVGPATVPSSRPQAGQHQRAVWGTWSALRLRPFGSLNPGTTSAKTERLPSLRTWRPVVHPTTTSGAVLRLLPLRLVQ